MMATFRYRAVTADDQMEAGAIDAADPDAAARCLLARGLYPVAITARRRTVTELLAMPLGRRLSVSEVAQILADLGHLIEAGVEIASALAVIASSVSTDRARAVVVALAERVRKGWSLSHALADFESIFSREIVAVVRTGELSGGLGKALIRLADAQRRAAKLRSQLRTALIYPGCVAAAMTLAIIVLVGVVVPTLETLFAGETHRLPWQTRLLVAIGQAVRNYSVALTVGALTLPFLVFIALRMEQVRKRLEGLALRIPVIGALLSLAESARVAILLSMLCSAGLPLGNALGLAGCGARLLISREAYAAAALRLREGARLYEALSNIPTLNGRVLALAQIGETTARLGPLLEEAARDAEHQVSTAIERALALLTPAMTLIFGAVAGFILYAVMTSILSVNDLATTGL
jgi:general secretion pathway protein F